MRIHRVRVEVSLVDRPAVIVLQVVHQQFVLGRVGYIGERVLAIAIPRVHHDISQQRFLLDTRRRERVRSCETIYRRAVTPLQTNTRLVCARRQRDGLNLLIFLLFFKS